LSGQESLQLAIVPQTWLAWPADEPGTSGVDLIRLGCSHLYLGVNEIVSTGKTISRQAAMLFT